MTSERTADADIDPYEVARKTLEQRDPPYAVLLSAAEIEAMAEVVARNQQLQEALARLVTYADNAEQKMRREYRAAGETYADEDWPKTEMESWAEGEALQDVLAEARAALASVRARTP